MKKSTRTTLTVISGFLLFGVGLFRLLTETLSSTSLFVTYVFIIAGLIGFVGNGILLLKSKAKTK
ncbi:hypothetical protein V7124_18200 [Neobacillus niacini]|uniref:hypothetical protein n=1 Tax=Neobacillus niacini TaxID=86668 RepID=UPI002FFF6DE4